MAVQTTLPGVGCPASSVVDPNPVGSETFSRIQIPKNHSGSTTMPANAVITSLTLTLKMFKWSIKLKVSDLR
jgi:hypothetical protein